MAMYGGVSIGTVVANQGYSIFSNKLNCYGTIRGIGVAEREELTRADLIDIIVDERLKHEQDKGDDDMD